MPAIVRICLVLIRMPRGRNIRSVLAFEFDFGSAQVSKPAKNRAEQGDMKHLAVRREVGDG